MRNKCWNAILPWLRLSEINLHFSDKIFASRPKNMYKIGQDKIMSDLKSIIAAQIGAGDPDQVWVLTDFAQLGNRDAIDKTLQRIVQAGDLRSIDRGL